MQICLRLEPADYVRLDLFWILKKTWWALAIVSLLGVACWYFWQADPKGLYYMIWPALIFGMYAPLLLYLTYSSAARKCPKGENAKVEYILSELQFCSVTAQGRGELNWSAIRKVVESRRLFHFVLDNGLVIPLPKRVLGDSEIARLRSLVQDKGTKAAGYSGGSFERPSLKPAPHRKARI